MSASAVPTPVRDPRVVSTFHLGRECAGHGSASGEFLPGTTVVVCTRLRAASLVRMLESLTLQDRRPTALLVVDASPDGSTERALLGLSWLGSIAGCILYFRVAGGLVGLTRQRNFSLAQVATDLVVFFDDDVILAPACLGALERTLRRRTDLVGAGAVVEGERLPRIWRLRRWVGIVSTLEPGRYCRSGMSVPWGSPPEGSEPRDGDWLPGCGMMWRAREAASLGFDEEFSGYGQGEDLEFSRRAAAVGGLALVPAARLSHVHEPSGRPDDFHLGYGEIANRFEIHRRLPGRTWRDVLCFGWAWSLDTLLLARSLRVPGRASPALRQAAGRLSAAWDLAFRSRRSRSGARTGR